MSSFSERMGITQSFRPIQLDGIDKPLLNRLWNVYLGLDAIPNKLNVRDLLNNYTVTIWHYVFKENYDTAPVNYYDLKDFISDYFF